MAATRTQLTTYLSDDKQLDDWRLIKAHYGDQGDAIVIRKMIEDFARIIRDGGVGPPSSEERFLLLEEEIAAIKKTLRQLNK